MSEVDEQLAEEFLVVAADLIVGDLGHNAFVFENEQFGELISFLRIEYRDERVETLGIVEIVTCRLYGRVGCDVRGVDFLRDLYAFYGTAVVMQCLRVFFHNVVCGNFHFRYGRNDGRGGSRVNGSNDGCGDRRHDFCGSLRRNFFFLDLFGFFFLCLRLFRRFDLLLAAALFLACADHDLEKGYCRRRDREDEIQGLRFFACDDYVANAYAEDKLHYVANEIDDETFLGLDTDSRDNEVDRRYADEDERNVLEGEQFFKRGNEVRFVFRKAERDRYDHRRGENKLQRIDERAFAVLSERKYEIDERAYADKYEREKIDNAFARRVIGVAGRAERVYGERRSEEESGRAKERGSFLGAEHRDHAENDCEREERDRAVEGKTRDFTDHTFGFREYGQTVRLICAVAENVFYGVEKSDLFRHVAYDDLEFKKEHDGYADRGKERGEDACGYVLLFLGGREWLALWFK